jgi:SecD/SecF fusion protein
MSERRRYSLVLLLVLALIGAAIAVVATRSTVLGSTSRAASSSSTTPSRPRSRRPSTPTAMQRSIDLMQQRVNQFGVSEAEINQAGQDQIEVGLPGVKDAERAAQQVGSTAQLFFYDWEDNLLDEKCKTTPDAERQHAASPRSGSTRRSSGVEVHERRRRP